MELQQVIKKWETVLEQDSGKDIVYSRAVLLEMFTDIKQLNIPGVSNRRELLLAFLLFVNPEFESPEDFVINYERFLSNSC